MSVETQSQQIRRRLGTLSSQPKIFRAAASTGVDTDTYPAVHAWNAPHDRISVSDLIALYAVQIQLLAQELAPLIDSHPQEDPLVIDELFLLRHLLSNQTALEAIASTTAALEYRRHEPNLKLARAIESGGVGLPMFFWADCFGSTITSHGDLILYLTMCTNDMFDKMEALPDGEIVVQEQQNKEIVYQYLDFETRRRGYLVKSYIVLDYKDMVVTRAMSVGMRFLPDIRTAHELTKGVFPQMEAALVLVNSPWLDMIITIATPFLSAKAFEKVRIHSTFSQLDSIDGLPVREAINTVPSSKNFALLVQSFMTSSIDSVVCSSSPPALRTEATAGAARSGVLNRLVQLLARCLPCSVPTRAFGRQKCDGGWIRSIEEMRQCHIILS